MRVVERDIGVGGGGGGVGKGAWSPGTRGIECDVTFIVKVLVFSKGRSRQNCRRRCRKN